MANPKCPHGRKKTELMPEADYQERVKNGTIKGEDWAKEKDHTFLRCDTCHDWYLFRLR